MRVTTKFLKTLIYIILPVITILLFVAGCDFHPDYEISLPNDYHLVRTNFEEVTIYKHRSSDYVVSNEVGPRVAQANITGNIVYGEVVKPKGLEIARPNPVGYFIINTKTDEVQTGLLYSDWKVRLGNLGIKDIRLVSPGNLN
jgi:hypothetical protein